MSRPIWKGHITFGLVNIPVILYSAEKRTDIHLTMIDSRDKARIHYQRINEFTGQEVPWHDIAKGFAFDSDNYILLKEQDIKKIAGENEKLIEIVNFIDQKTLDFTYFEKPYYLVPDKKGEKGYVLLRETLNKANKIGIAKLFIRTKEYLAALIPSGEALMIDLLRYPHEIIDPSEFEFPTAAIKDYKITAKEMEIATQLLESMTSQWVPKNYQDEYRLSLQKWIDEKVDEEHGAPKTKRKKKSTKAAQTNVVDFVDLLKNSLKNKKTITSPKHKKSHAKK